MVPPASIPVWGLGSQLLGKLRMSCRPSYLGQTRDFHQGLDNPPLRLARDWRLSQLYPDLGIEGGGKLRGKS